MTPSSPWSLRARLTAIILLPLMVVTAGIAWWQIADARATATDLFNRSLLTAALAVVNDVAQSDGDALSERTRDILADTSGGPVFYHVYAPDGVIVAGYATPPVGIPSTPGQLAQPTYFTATYHGQSVSGVRLLTQTEVDGFSGIFTTTVWQAARLHATFVQALVLRAVATLGGLTLAVALIVWFGVRFGLSPLLDLERAIAARSGDELSAIQRPVPKEVQGVVTTLNRLFAQVSRSLAAQSEFISNAAHQLRNPIAGMLSLAEAVQSAPSHADAKTRAADLVKAGRDTADLSQKLLLLERASAGLSAGPYAAFDLAAMLREVVEARLRDGPAQVTIRYSGKDAPCDVTGDAVMLREAVVNLIDNALRHGGPEMTRIDVALLAEGREVCIRVSDNGRGLAEADLPRAVERFSMVSATSASGLGLSIVEAVAKGHGGSLKLQPGETGFVAEIRLGT